MKSRDEFAEEVAETYDGDYGLGSVLAEDIPTERLDAAYKHFLEHLTDGMDEDAEYEVMLAAANHLNDIWTPDTATVAANREEVFL